jgi:hypothetical protein
MNEFKKRMLTRKSRRKGNSRGRVFREQERYWSTTEDTSLEKVDKDFQQKTLPGLIWRTKEYVRRDKRDNVKEKRKIEER